MGGVALREETATQGTPAGKTVPSRSVDIGHIWRVQIPWTHVRINVETGLVVLVPEARLDSVGPAPQQRPIGAEDGIRLTHKAGLSFPFGAAGT